MEKKLKHLEMIQNIITRLANNSFSLKGWTVIFIAAVLGFAIKESNPNYIPLVLFPIFAFWGWLLFETGKNSSEHYMIRLEN